MSDVSAPDARPTIAAFDFDVTVSGNAHEGSDLDIVLRNPSNLKAEVPNRLDVQEAIQESDLPMLVDVHDWAHLPEDFHRNIERDYVEIQAGAVDG